MSYEKEYRHCLENTNKRELVDKIIYDEKEFIKKDIEIYRLNKENQKYKEVFDKLNDLLIIKKARCLNEDNYVLNVPDLDDILQVLKEVE